MSEGEKFKILIADDEKANIMALNHILKPTYSTFVATNGCSAIEIAMEIIPDLILLDIIMPVLTGFDVMTTLRHNYTTKDIPIICITGLDSLEDEEMGFFLGAVDYITKPFRSSIVKARVRTHLMIVKQMRAIEAIGMIDSLTEIANRRSFDKRIRLEWTRAQRDGTSICMLMIDIDNFKIYNDTYGHPQGDVILYTVAQILESSAKRSGDFVARWGGEEFAALLPNTSLEGAVKLAEMIRKEVEDAVVVSSDNTKTSITISIGVNVAMPSQQGNIGEFVFGADKALYAAKQNGKNMVCISHI